MSSFISKEHTDAVYAAYKLWDDDKLVECHTACMELLDDRTMPRYHRVKVLMLLDKALEEDEPKEEWPIYEAHRSAGEDEPEKELPLEEVHESADMVIHDTDDDIEATSEELKATKEESEASKKAENDTEANSLKLPVVAKARKVSRNEKFLKFDLAASLAENDRKDTQAADLAPEPRTPFGSIPFADAAKSGKVVKK
ncbi:hypothetical protein OPT61_g8806 [Boeremia exigua]|uniref:Uncharacterized protein n=1 Tax=Boeremia exigua TaxID=749465 RepID=A0ACC2HXM1_9PLEO|nr:hypothetical protein OPT61_g8806 [Boeremia exigua]